MGTPDQPIKAIKVFLYLDASKTRPREDSADRFGLI
jgi:hypothetical protein